MPAATVDREAEAHTAPAALTAEWDVRGIDITQLVMDARGTIKGMPQAGGAKRTVADPVRTLPPVVTQASDASGAQLEIGSMLGEGGMGVVWSAKQIPLRREVAVKSTHPGASIAVTHQLLREARVTMAAGPMSLRPLASTRSPRL